eukprot:324401_1
MNAYRLIQSINHARHASYLTKTKHIRTRYRLLSTKIINQIHLPPAPIQFQTICILTGVIITCGSLYMLQENLLFGTVAGITAKTCTAPLERLVTHRQASIDTKYSIPSVAIAIYNEEGILGFWRGNGLNVFRASIQKGSLFALNDFFRSLISVNWMQESPVISFICGAMAGLSSTMITYPLDPIKTVNQATIHKQKWPAMTIWYSLSNEKGYLRGPWVAALPTFVGTTIYYGFKFMTFDLIVRKMNVISDRNDIKIATDLRNATAGLCSGIIGNSITYPNNCIRKRMQTTHVCHAIGIDSGYVAEKYVQTAIRLVSEGGIARLYRGFGINLCRNAPNTAIQFVVYKRLQRMWNKQEDG